MKIITKLKISRITSLVMIVTTLGILIWFLGFIISVTFKLQLFDNSTTDFLFSALAGAFVLVACSAILNVSLNISIIAEKNLIVKDNDRINYKKLIITIILVVLSVFIFMISGNFISRNITKNGIIKEGNDIVSRYSSTVENIKNNLQSEDKLSEIPKDLKFLSKIIGSNAKFGNVVLACHFRALFQKLSIKAPLSLDKWGLV